MRKRNNRISVRLTEEDYEKVLDCCKRGKLTQEAFWRNLIKGYEILVAPPEFYQELFILVRKTGIALYSFKSYFDLERASFGPALERAVKLLYDTEFIMDFVFYCNRKRFYKDKVNWSVKNDN